VTYEDWVMMDTYLMMLYVSLDQETAVRQLFQKQGWNYAKPGNYWTF